MKDVQLAKEYYIDISNLGDLLKRMTDSYRLLIGGAFELNNIYEAKTRYVKSAVERADKLGDIIDNLIKVLDKCSESYLEYCDEMNNFILKGDSSKNGNKKNQILENKVILTEVENLLFNNSTVEKGTIDNREE